MIKRIGWKTNDDLYFLGRNGYGKCSGLEIGILTEDVVSIEPLTSRAVVGRARITIPVDKIPAVIEALRDLEATAGSNKKLIRPPRPHAQG